MVTGDSILKVFLLKDVATFTEYEGEQAGLSIRCPNCGTHGAVQFEGTKWALKTQYALWKRTGDSLENLSLTPSVAMSGHFHSWVRNGYLEVDTEFVCIKEVKHGS